MHMFDYYYDIRLSEHISNFYSISLSHLSYFINDLAVGVFNFFYTYTNVF